MSRKAVYAIARDGERTFWNRIGSCDVLPGGELVVRLDAVPVSGELRIRDAEPLARAPHVSPRDRYIVTFECGYETIGVAGPAEAAELAADLLANGSCCRVLDRETGETHMFELSPRHCPRTYTAKPWTGTQTDRGE